MHPRIIAISDHSHDRLSQFLQSGHFVFASGCLYDLVGVVDMLDAIAVCLGTHSQLASTVA